MGIGSFMSNVFNAAQVGWQAARRAYDEPNMGNQYRSFYRRISEYDLLWSYYNSSAFDRAARFLNNQIAGGYYGPYLWDRYKANYNLYRNIRLIYNPTTRLVNFYAGQVYPGVLSEDGSKLPDGVPLAIPFSDDTSPALRSAIAQIWQWSNWQQKKAVEVRYCAALGSVLVEVEDDLDRGKVCLSVCWPGTVVDLDLDNAGNVKSYTIEYYTYEDGVGQYRYKKTVDQQYFRYFKDDEPFDYGYGAVVENPYGFVPAVWIKHSDMGGDHGAPVISGTMGKIDELNNLASHVHDQIHKVIGAPLLISSKSKITNLFSTQKRGPTSDFLEPSTDQESVLMLAGPEDAKAQTLAGDLNLADAALHMDRIITEIENDHPELSFYKELRTMSQVTGPGAQRMMGDVEQLVIEAQAGYDLQNIKLFQMAVAMAGFRANSGNWGPLNSQQQKFAPFNLDSYEAGDLEMAIMPRPLLNSTKLERAQENLAIWTGVQAAANAGVPLEFVLEQEGWTPQELKKLAQAKQKQDQADQAKFEQQQKVIAQNQPSQDGNQQEQNDQQNKQPIGQKG
jgi:hypothetical protein